jgi:hypothetical protein
MCEEDMEENEKDIWFPAKKYGFGWGLPVRWQGWMVLLIYTMLIAAGIVFIGYSENQIWFYVYCSISTIILILICWKKGDTAKWRWGNKK